MKNPLPVFPRTERKCYSFLDREVFSVARSLPILDEVVADTLIVGRYKSGLPPPGTYALASHAVTGTSEGLFSSLQ